MEFAPRIVPDYPFPKYSYVPGMWPHPTGEPYGHGFGRPELESQSIGPKQRRDLPPYLLGFDICNYGHYLEMHGAPEAVRVMAGRHAKRCQHAVREVMVRVGIRSLLDRIPTLPRPSPSNAKHCIYGNVS